MTLKGLSLPNTIKVYLVRAGANPNCIVILAVLVSKLDPPISSPPRTFLEYHRWWTELIQSRVAALRFTARLVTYSHAGAVGSADALSQTQIPYKVVFCPQWQDTKPCITANGMLTLPTSWFSSPHATKKAGRNKTTHDAKSLSHAFITTHDTFWFCWYDYVPLPMPLLISRHSSLGLLDDQVGRVERYGGRVAHSLPLLKIINLNKAVSVKIHSVDRKTKHALQHLHIMSTDTARRVKHTWPDSRKRC